MNRKQRRAAKAAPPTLSSASPSNIEGCAFLRQGRFAEAANALRQALTADPTSTTLMLDLGNASLQLGHLNEAIALYQQALALKPDFAEAKGNLGLALVRRGATLDGIGFIEQAIKLKPDFAEAHCNLGNALLKLGRLKESEVALREGLRLKPEHAIGYNDLGNVLYCSNKLAEAVSAYQQAIALQPGFAEAYSNFSNPLIDLDRCDEAVAALEKSLALKPDYPEAHSNLGNALVVLDRLEEARQAYESAIRLKPEYPEAWSNLGNVLIRLGRREDAVAAYRRAIELNPDYVEAHFHYSMALLRQGDFAEGWAEAEWRWQTKSFAAIRPRYAQPEWRGENLMGKTLLLYAEQGFGDTLQFCRYAPLFTRLGARVILRAQAPLQRILTSVPGVAAVIMDRETPPPFDYHLPLLCAPYRLGTTLDTIPAETPYLFASDELIKAWHWRLAGLSGRKIGLVWSGDPRPHDRAAGLVDRRRSLTLQHFSRLAEIEDVSFISLQKGKPAEQAKAPPAGLVVHNFMDQVADFADTAALIANLDLVISVDTAVAHLAGALGKPVWILSRFDACWRWLYEREDTPWYPAAQLFHQPAPGAWDEVITRITQALKDNC